MFIIIYSTHVIHTKWSMDCQFVMEISACADK